MSLLESHPRKAVWIGTAITLAVMLLLNATKLRTDPWGSWAAILGASIGVHIALRLATPRKPNG